MYQVFITRAARRDMQNAYRWWGEHRSKTEADRWFLGIHQAIQSLRLHPERCPFAIEKELSDTDIRQLLFGSGRRKTHRIVYAIRDQTVAILRVRHSSQDSLTQEDLS